MRKRVRVTITPEDLLAAPGARGEGPYYTRIDLVCPAARALSRTLGLPVSCGVYTIATAQGSATLGTLPRRASDWILQYENARRGQGYYPPVPFTFEAREVLV